MIHQHPCPQGKRVQRSRRKGSRTPEGAIYVGRPTMWGNPFAVTGRGHAKATILHKEWLAGHLGALTLERMGYCPAEIDALGRLRERVLTQLHRLASHDLACWCPLTSQWCHAETLLVLAPAHAEFERLAVAAQAGWHAKQSPIYRNAA
jgi:hypothetical protein